MQKKLLPKIKNETAHLKSVSPFNSMNFHIHADGFFTSFFNHPQNHHHSCGRAREWPAQSVIFTQDTPAVAVYLIEQGLVKLVRVTSSGNQVIVGLRHRNWLMGAPAIFLDKVYSYTAIPVLPTVVRSIPRESFLELVKKDEQFSLQVHRLLSRNIFNQMNKMEETSYLSARKRLLVFLSGIIRDLQGAASGTHETFALPLTNQDLAQLLAITPEHLCRVLKGLEEDGLLKRDSGTVILTDSKYFCMNNNLNQLS